MDGPGVSAVDPAYDDIDTVGEDEDDEDEDGEDNEDEDEEEEDEKGSGRMEVFLG
jgi:hypothetical protein